MRKIKLPVARGALIYLALGCVSALVIIGFGLIPQLGKAKDLQTDITRLEGEFQAHQLLVPAGKALNKALKRLEQLRGPDHGAVSSAPLTDAPDRLAELAEVSGMAEASFDPSPESVARGQNGLRVACDMLGSPDAVRDFLLRLTEDPLFLRLEHMWAEAQAPGEMAVSMRVWLSIGDNDKKERKGRAAS
jgi:hypothetical protein